MVELLIAAVLLDTSLKGPQADPAASQPVAATTNEKLAVPTNQTKPWTMPKLNFSVDDGCYTFARRELGGFGNLKVGTPCTSRPSEAASKGRSADKRN